MIGEPDREVYFEFTAMGGVVKAAAIDAQTGLEVTVWPGRSARRAPISSGSPCGSSRRAWPGPAAAGSLHLAVSPASRPRTWRIPPDVLSAAILEPTRFVPVCPAGAPMSLPDTAAKADRLFTASLDETDPEIAEAIGLELGRQRDEIELIASENIVSRAVLEAQGSVLTNKYAELPGKRYYGGCQYVDIAERLADRAVTKLFGCCLCQCQPHSGAQANAAAFMALMQPGDTFMGLNLAAGASFDPWFAGQHVGQVVQGRSLWRAPRRSPYRLRRGGEAGPRAPAQVIRRRWSAYPRILDFRRFREIADAVGAILMVDMAHFAGLVAAHPSPFPHAHVVTSTTHKTCAARALRAQQRRGTGEKSSSAVFTGQQGGPLMHVIAAKAVAFGEALRPSFRLYARNRGKCQGARRDAQIRRPRHRVRRTDTHLMLVDLRPKRLTGKWRKPRSAAPTSPATRTASRSIRRNRR